MSAPEPAPGTGAGSGSGGGPGDGSGDERPVIDPDADLADPARLAETAGPGKWRVPAAIAAGGALGASARYAASLARPAGGDAFPWTVFVVNVTGCALIGVLMVLVAERPGAVSGAKGSAGGGPVPHPLLRPFLGVGVLGGFTTFSTYAADVSKLLARQEVLTAMLYATTTVVGALTAVWGAAAGTRALVRLVHRSGRVA